jgi:hypothetical protein
MRKRRAKSQAPSSKHQRSSEHQAPSHCGVLRLGAWSFFGAWSLGLGFFLSARWNARPFTHHKTPYPPTSMAKKPLNIGIVGYGFMGRTHANGFSQAPHFFDLPVKPVLKAACGRDAAKAQSYADKWGVESIETDWKAHLHTE